jgi:hypothetical protein
VARYLFWKAERRSSTDSAMPPRIRGRRGLSRDSGFTALEMDSPGAGGKGKLGSGE